MIRQDIIELFRVLPETKIRLRNYDTGWAQTKELRELGKDVIKERAKVILEKNLTDLAEAQERLWADDRYAVWAPWYVIPADHKWGTRTVVADILTTTIGGLDLRYPEVTEAQRQALEQARTYLEHE
jgi:hypothetical protein